MKSPRVYCEQRDRETKDYGDNEDYGDNTDNRDNGDNGDNKDNGDNADKGDNTRRNNDTTKQRVTINISGEIFETRESTLNRFPSTLLGNPRKRKFFWCVTTRQYFFERHRPCFSFILFFYQSNGILRCPRNIPVRHFENECRFFQLPEQMIAVMKQQEGILLDLEVKKRLPSMLDSIMFMKFDNNNNNNNAKIENSTALKARVWEMLEYPETSQSGYYILMVSCVAVFLSTVTTCLATVPSLNPQHDTTTHNAATHHIHVNIWFVSELLFNIYFVFELSIRFACCPNKLKFIRTSSTIMDAIATFSFFVMLFCIKLTGGRSKMSFTPLRIFRFLRILRIFRLHKTYYRKLQIVLAVLRSAVEDFKMLGMLLFFTVTLVGNAMYYIEKDPRSDFTDIPNSNWWAVITLTTSGYGDIVPMTVFGRIVASFYMLFGAMTITLPALSIGSKLKTIYDKNVCVDQDQVYLKGKKK